MRRPRFTQRKGGKAATVRVAVTVWEENWDELKKCVEESGLSFIDYVTDACEAGLYARMGELNIDDEGGE